MARLRYAALRGSRRAKSPAMLTFKTRRMSQSRSSPNEPSVDDFPARADAITHDNRILSGRIKGQKRTIILFCLIYFLYGTGLSMYSLLYPKLARKNGLPSWVYGSVLASSHLMCVLFYPLSCGDVCKVSIRNSVSVGVFVIGSCRILFGTLYLILEQTSFLILSYAIQLVEGIGISIIIASTVITIGTLPNNQIWKFSLAIQACLCLGLTLGPPTGPALNEVLGFDIIFYIIGGTTVLCVTLTTTLLKEPEQRITYTDMPIVYWMSDKRMLVYFFIMLETFIYVGFLTVSLGIILKKFNLNKFYFATIFSLVPFVYGLTLAGWKWLIRKGFNNVMLVFIGCVFVVASLILIGPVPFTSLQTSLTYVCLALGLEGLGLAVKCTGVLDASEKDLRYKKKHTEIQQKLIVPTIALLGSSFGYFCGLLTAGLMDNYLGYRKATVVLFILEILTAIGVVIFAMNRNYVSKRRREAVSESRPILRS